MKMSSLYYCLAKLNGHNQVGLRHFGNPFFLVCYNQLSYRNLIRRLDGDLDLHYVPDQEHNYWVSFSSHSPVHIYFHWVPFQYLGGSGEGAHVSRVSPLLKILWAI